MTEAEKVDRLLQALDTSELAWVASQVREHIRTGRTTIRTETTASADLPNARPDEAEADQLSAGDALNAMRQALSVVVLDLPAMEAEVHRFFQSRLAGFNQISFTTEPMDEAVPFQLGPPDRQREDQRTKVRTALVELVGGQQEKHGD